MTDRAVSTVMGYTLTLGISSLLVVGLLVATGGFVDDHRQQTIRDELQVVGHQLAADLSAADRMVRVGDDEEISIERRFPDDVTGVDYRIEVKSSSTELELRTDDPEVTVTIPVTIQTDLSDGTIEGGDVEIVYDSEVDELEVRDD